MAKETFIPENFLTTPTESESTETTDTSNDVKTLSLLNTISLDWEPGDELYYDLAARYRSF